MSEDQAWTVAKRYHAVNRKENDKTKINSEEQCDPIPYAYAAGGSRITRVRKGNINNQ